MLLCFVSLVCERALEECGGKNGFTDWSDTYGPERRVGLNHSIFNVGATILYLVSFILRLLAGPGDGIVAPILGFVGLVSVSYAAYLGGEMVFSKGTGVNHTAWEAASEDDEAVRSRRTHSIV